MPDTVKLALAETCGFASVGGRRVHYRKMGSGPVMVMLHASPLSSKSLRPGMKIFSEKFTCIALDTPSFGLSDPLSDTQVDMFDHADALKDTLDAFGFADPIIYGASTGAAITHAFGSKYPDRARLLMLDTFSHHDADDTMEGYFPDLTPRRDGRHFLAAWEKIEGLFLFSPWQKADSGRRQIRDLPPVTVMHDMTMQQLAAHPAYKYTYGEAIKWESKDNVTRLKAPVTINIWPSGSNMARVRMITDNNLPSNYIPIESDPGPEGRYLKQLQYLTDNRYHVQDPKDAAPIAGAHNLPKGYTQTGRGQVFWRKAGHDRSQPVLLLHEWGESSKSLIDLLDAHTSSQLIIAPDLPGHGDTPVGCASDDSAFNDMVDILADFIEVEALSDLRIVGFGSGYSLAHALQARVSSRIDQISFVATSPATSSQSDQHDIQTAPFDLKLAAGGAHFISAFSLAKRRAVFWPWWQTSKTSALVKSDPLEPEALSEQALDLLKCTLSVGGLHRQSSAYLENQTPTGATCFVPNWDVGQHPLREHKRLSGFRSIIDLPASPQHWTGPILDALF